LTGTAVTDSYIATTEEADAVLAKRLGTAAWTASTSATKIAALQQATSVIDALTFAGVTQSSTQARQFPRKHLVDITEFSPWSNLVVLDIYGYYSESATVPDKVILACALEALALIQYYDNANVVNEQELIDKGVKSFSLGKLSMTFGESTASTYGLKSIEAYRLLQDYIENSVLIV
jgi:hypothetical protein